MHTIGFILLSFVYLSSIDALRILEPTHEEEHKVALCFSGQPRTLRRLVGNIQDSHLTPLGKAADVYLSMHATEQEWKEKAHVLQEAFDQLGALPQRITRWDALGFDDTWLNQHISQNSDQKKFYGTTKATDILREQQKKFMLDIFGNATNAPHDADLYEAIRAFYTAPMGNQVNLQVSAKPENSHYQATGLAHCAKMIIVEETKLNIQYHWVAKLRPDMGYTYQLPKLDSWASPKEDRLWAPAHAWEGCVKDTANYMNRASMNVYFVGLNKAVSGEALECTIGSLMAKNSVHVHRCPCFPFKLVDTGKAKQIPTGTDWTHSESTAFGPYKNVPELDNPLSVCECIANSNIA